MRAELSFAHVKRAILSGRLAMQGSKKLKDYLIDRQIDLPFRDDWPLVCQGSEVLWVIGRGRV